MNLSGVSAFRSNGLGRGVSDRNLIQYPRNTN